MKLKDVNGSAINPDKIPVINPSAINTDKLTLTLVLGSERYMFTYLKLDDLTEFPCDIFSKNASPTLWPHRLVNKTKNNFCNYYKLINLAYLYDKTHYDLQTSTGEKYYYFNLLQDDRFKKENIQEFISSYCRKHNK